MSSARTHALRRSVGLRARRAVPDQLRPAIRAGLDAVDPLTVRAYRRRTGFAGPIPPRRLRARIGQPDVERFIAHGRRVAGELDAAASAAGVPLAEAQSVLDFGCGCGRVLLPLLEVADSGARLAGCDVDEQAIRWLAASTAGRADCRVNEFMPPLPFEDGRFSVLYTVSILTHLDEPTQDSWLAEFHRLLEPGGIALVSVHGPHPYEVFCRGDQQGTSAALLRRLGSHGSLAEEGFVFEAYDSTRGRAEELPGISGAYGLAFQSASRVAERWSQRFTVEAQLERAILDWQDLVVLRRRG